MEKSRFKDSEMETSLAYAIGKNKVNVAGHTEQEIEYRGKWRAARVVSRGLEGVLIIHSKSLKLILSICEVDNMSNVPSSPTSLYLCLSQCKFAPLPSRV